MHNRLLHLALGRALTELQNGDPGAWSRASTALVLARDDDPEIDESEAGLAVQLEDQDELARLVAGWTDGSLPLPTADKAILKRAMKAARKRLKLARLDDESTLGGTSMTGGKTSALSSIRPPEQYPEEVWAYLVQQGKLRDIGHGLLEIVEQ